MYFSLTSKEISIYIDPSTHHTYMNAECRRKAVDLCVYNSVRLDDKFGYSRYYDRFHLKGLWDIGQDDGIPENLYDQVKPGTLKLKGNSLLVGTLIDSLGGKETSICLDFFFDNDDGNLEFQGISDDVRKRMVKYNTDPGSAVLRGLVLGRDGLLHFKELPLGPHYKNVDGYLKQGKDGDFYMTATEWHMTDKFEFAAHLQEYDKSYRWDTYPVFKDIIVAMNGDLSINDPIEYGFFDLRGEFARFLEKIPGLGYQIAAIDAIAGDTDEAKRAAAECTYSTIVLGASIAGATLGGPVGAALGSSIAALAAPYVRAAIADTISDPTMRKQLTGVSIYNVLMGEVFAIAGIGIGQIGSEFADFLTEELTDAGADELFTEMAAMLGKNGLNTLTKYDLRKIVDTIVAAITNGKNEDWIIDQLGGQPDPTPIQIGGSGDGDGSNRPGSHIPYGHI